MNIGDKQAPENPLSLKGFERLVTQEMVNLYADVSGDHNPVHLDEDFAATTRFGTRVVHGMLALALLSELLERNFLDAWRRGGAVMKTQFRAPIFPGETVRLHCSVERVSEADDETQTAFVKAFCTKSDGKDAVTARVELPILHSRTGG